MRAWPWGLYLVPGPFVSGSLPFLLFLAAMWEAALLPLTILHDVLPPLRSTAMEPADHGLIPLDLKEEIKSFFLSYYLVFCHSNRTPPHTRFLYGRSTHCLPFLAARYVM